MVQMKLNAIVIFIFISGIWAAEALVCLKCDSTADPNCIADLSKVTDVEECTTKCFTKVDTTGKITRGCSAATDTCATPDCLDCNDDKCNKNNICKKCDSSTDGACSKTDSNDNKYNSVCESEQTQCTKIVNSALHVERRCATADDAKCDPASATCKLCPEPNCNIGIFPADRRQCYQCAITDTKCSNVDLNTDTIKSEPCLLYKSDDVCYTFGTSATTMSRGCVSDPDTTTNVCSVPGSNKACATCLGNSCNNLMYTHVQKTKCVECSDANCQWGKNVEDAVNCKKEIPYNEEGGCYTKTADDKTVSRGCINDLEGECNNDDKCKICATGDGCNNKDSGVFSCVQCRSNEYADCRLMSKEIKGESCTNTVTQDVAECFTGNWNGVVIRGCLVDADSRQNLECKGGEFKHCVSCKTADCNNVKWSGAAAMKITSSLFLGILIIIWRLH